MPRPPSDISTRIIHAARERFLQEGVDGASLRQIAKDADTNIGMVYYYFPTKDELFVAVFEEIYAVLLKDLTQILSGGAPVEERIRGMFLRFGRISDEEFTVLRLLIREALLSSKRLGKLFEHVAGGHLPLLLSTLMEGVTEKKLTKKHHVIVLALVSGLLGILPQIMRRQVDSVLPSWLSPPKGEELAEVLCEILFSGIKRRAEEG